MSEDVRSKEISNLIQQLKNGDIDKAQLFQKLSSLQTASASSSSMASESNSPSPDRRSGDLSASEKRKAMIQRLVAEKTANSNIANDIVEQQSYVAPTNDVELDQELETNAERGDLRQEEAGSSNEGWSSDFYSQDSGSFYFIDKMDQYIDHKNSRRKEVEQQMVHQQMIECTFHPAINELPRRYGTMKDQDIPFHKRVTRWKKKKDDYQSQRKKELMDAELQECTFVPTINSKSQKVVQKRRTKEEVPVTERLYQDKELYKAREELAAQVQQQREEEYQRICTFKPQINSHSKRIDSGALESRSRYMDSVQKNPSAAKLPNAVDDECTFRPKINPLRQEMEAAHEYVRTNIFERLSSPALTANSLNNNRNIEGEVSSSQPQPREWSLLTMDDEFSMNQQQNEFEFGNSNTSETVDAVMKSKLKDGEKRAKQKRFNEFLGRQEKTQQSKLKASLLRSDAGADSFQPKINSSSRKMVDGHLINGATFLDRLEAQAVKRERNHARNKNRFTSDPECTFTPKINQQSTELKSRSVIELSRGDMLKRETALRFMKLKKEQEEMMTLTFKPKLNEKHLPKQGTLNILSQPDTYLQRVQSKAKEQSEKQRLAIYEQEVEQFAECTFKPKVHDAPAYVTRIARSMALAKAAKVDGIGQQGVKPCWK